MTLNKIKKKEICVVLIPPQSYKKKEMEVVKHLAKTFKTVCYTNTNSPLSSLMSEMKKNKVDANKFLFIDAVTKKSDKQQKNCLYIESPHALVELSLVIKTSLSKGQFEVLLFDSLSSLLTYHKIETLTKFMHDLFNEIKKYGVAGVFTLQAGTNKELLADISMFADNVIEVK